ncbi:hypothetical protein HYALB_00010040 [Hymenoscyphus albidus]|uniref:Uncharacterized protein n=1 Tax=Hymenoscyphus albidus TaxID=595503 RepID=A0A9N9PZZ1_9HELO|nr:hypothetical protein HYALB_00010040 [Hymenoscyphus albidus]
MILVTRGELGSDLRRSMAITVTGKYSIAPVLVLAVRVEQAVVSEAKRHEIIIIRSPLGFASLNKN